MVRGIYFDGWYRNNHCYHPSLPLRSMQMIEDIGLYKGTILVWSCLGGGSLSLPFLEHEAYGEVDPRMQIYGFMNDSEFISACMKRGIKPFGIVFEVQGWEMPVNIDKETGKMHRINICGGMEQTGWYGLREFTLDTYPGLFAKSFSDYFPNGIVNSDGEKVVDLLEECVSRKADGSPVHADWVEVRGHSHRAYQMCRNNPVWLEYLKKIIEIQIDAGVPGIQLDEPELPAISISSGGCLCKDCMKQFNAYLLRREQEGTLPAIYLAYNLSAFSLKDYMLENNIATLDKTPFYREYWEFLRETVVKYFSELVNYAKGYARDKYSRELLMSGNFFNFAPITYPIEPYADILITEMKHTLLKQSWFYRYCAGFAGDKPVIVAENPYRGIIPELVEMLNEGRGFDLYRLLLIEAAVYGCNMAVPYGAWMGNAIKDAFWPPHKATCEIQNFLAENEELYKGNSGSKICLLYSYASYYWREVEGQSWSIIKPEPHRILDYEPAQFTDPEAYRLPFWEVAKKLSDAQVIYDIRLLADGEVRQDTFTLSQILGYELLILPDCSILTQSQADVLMSFVNKGGKLLVLGRLAENTDLVDKLSGNKNVVFVENPADKAAAISRFMEAFDALHETLWNVRCLNKNISINTYINDGLICHLINYNYDYDSDMTLPISTKLIVRGQVISGELLTMSGEKQNLHPVYDGTFTTIELHSLPLYSVVAAKYG